MKVEDIRALLWRLQSLVGSEKANEAWELARDMEARLSELARHIDFGESAAGDFVDAVDVVGAMKPHIVTGGPWDDCFGGGLMPGSVSLLVGLPGSGKTTMMVQIAKAIADLTGKPSYILTTEQARCELKLTVDRLGLDLRRGQIVLAESTDRGLLNEKALDSNPPGMIVLDSLSAVCGEDTYRQIALAKAYRKYATRYNAPTFLIGHAVKELDFPDADVQRAVDTLVSLFPRGWMGIRILRAWRNRFGAVGREYKLVMTERGLVAKPRTETKGKKGKGRK